MQRGGRGVETDIGRNDGVARQGVQPGLIGALVNETAFRENAQEFRLSIRHGIAPHMLKSVQCAGFGATGPRDVPCGNRAGNLTAGFLAEDIVTEETAAVWALGLMSGTSMDGVDAALIRTDGERVFETGATYFHPYDPDVREAVGAVLGLTAETPAVRALEERLTGLNLDAVESADRKRAAFPAKRSR